MEVEIAAGGMQRFQKHNALLWAKVHPGAMLATVPLHHLTQQHHAGVRLPREEVATGYRVVSVANVSRLARSVRHVVGGYAHCVGLNHISGYVCTQRRKHRPDMIIQRCGGCTDYELQADYPVAGCSLHTVFGYHPWLDERRFSLLLRHQFSTIRYGLREIHPIK